MRTDSTNQLVDVDDAATWPPELAARVQSLANRLAGSTEYTPDLRVALEDEDEFRALLRGHLVRAYHCTRLLDHERDKVRAQGLRALSHELVDERLASAHAAGALSEELRADLLAGNALETRQGERREAQVCLVLSRNMFDEGVRGCVPLMESWGGEAIYFTEAGASHKAELRALGRPAIVVAGIDLSPSWQVHFTAPPLQNLFVGTALRLADRGSDVFYRASVPAEHVIEIWQPGHAEYDRHAELPR